MHLLLGLKTTHCLADFSRELKKATSVWAAERHCRESQWQEGYTVFSVSRSAMGVVSRYIEGQEEHHRRRGSRDELTALLARHGLEWDARFDP